MGQGSNEIGDRIPGYLNELGYIHISVSQNDRAHPMLPPYTAAEEKSLYEQAQDPNFKDYWNWNKSDSRKYFLAANESESRFEILWSHAMRHTEKISAALKNRTFNSAGGLIFYIISATKLKN